MAIRQNLLTKFYNISGQLERTMELIEKGRKLSL